jgi:hypothetical protein
MSMGPLQEEPGDGAGGDRADERDESRPPPRDEIPRRETGLRTGLTVLFVVVGSVLETVLAVIVLFELIVTLVTRRLPSPRVRDLANRVVSYYYRIGRYLTYNESHIPFPFSDFPDPVEPDEWSPEDRAARALGLRGSWQNDEPDADER